MLILQCFKC